MHNAYQLVPPLFFKNFFSFARASAPSRSSFDFSLRLIYIYIYFIFFYLSLVFSFTFLFPPRIDFFFGSPLENFFFFFQTCKSALFLGGVFVCLCQKYVWLASPICSGLLYLVGTCRHRRTAPDGIPSPWLLSHSRPVSPTWYKSGSKWIEGVYAYMDHIDILRACCWKIHFLFLGKFFFFLLLRKKNKIKK